MAGVGRKAGGVAVGQQLGGTAGRSFEGEGEARCGCFGVARKLRKINIDRHIEQAIATGGAQNGRIVHRGNTERDGRRIGSPVAIVGLVGKTVTPVEITIRGVAERPICREAERCGVRGSAQEIGRERLPVWIGIVGQHAGRRVAHKKCIFGSTKTVICGGRAGIGQGRVGGHRRGIGANFNESVAEQCVVDEVDNAIAIQVARGRKLAPLISHEPREGVDIIDVVDAVVVKVSKPSSEALDHIAR